ncbi:ankyrin repeat domain-containing protein 29-like [Haliotis asinina]|uniref:ankyrin repeat domain-containing protein 29-like n=1 Tax=Haliotis asinina TaxID=109174 RepID=UPI00353270BA
MCIFTDEKRNYPPKHEKQEFFANSLLHNACRRGDLNLVKHIVSRGLVDSNTRDGKHGRTPLMVAAELGHCGIFTFLIRKGANMSQVDNDGKSILHWAYKGGHMGMVECLLPQYRIHTSNVPHFMQAAALGLKEVLEFLVCMGANVSQVDHRGNNVLHWACRFGHVSTVEYVLAQGSVNINGRGRYGVTPLMVTARYGHKDVFEFLLCMGANVSHVNDDLDNVLHYASHAGHAEIVKYILSKEIINVNGKGKGGMTPLMSAARLGRIQIFDQLVRKGAATRLVDDNGNNILHLASCGDHLKMIQHIHSQNMTDIGAKNKKGKTAAMISVATHTRKRNMNKILASQGCLVK